MGGWLPPPYQWLWQLTLSQGEGYDHTSFIFSKWSLPGEFRRSTPSWTLVRGGNHSPYLGKTKVMDSDQWSPKLHEESKYIPTPAHWIHKPYRPHDSVINWVQKYKTHTHTHIHPHTHPTPHTPHTLTPHPTLTHTPSHKQKKTFFGRYIR